MASSSERLNAHSSLILLWIRLEMLIYFTRAMQSTWINLFKIFLVNSPPSDDEISSSDEESHPEAISRSRTTSNELFVDVSNPQLRCDIQEGAGLPYDRESIAVKTDTWSYSQQGRPPLICTDTHISIRNNPDRIGLHSRRNLKMADNGCKCKLKHQKLEFGVRFIHDRGLECLKARMHFAIFIPGGVDERKEDKHGRIYRE